MPGKLVLTADVEEFEGFLSALTRGDVARGRGSGLVGGFGK